MVGLGTHRARLQRTAHTLTSNNNATKKTYQHLAFEKRNAPICSWHSIVPLYCLSFCVKAVLLMLKCKTISLDTRGNKTWNEDTVRYVFDD